MVKIRLQRAGAKKKPFYKIVAADLENKRDGRFLEIIGSYDPAPNPSKVMLREDRVRYWLSVGAQPTSTVARLIAAQGITKEKTA